MNLIPFPYRILIVVALLALFGWWCYGKGAASVQADWDKAVDDAKLHASQTETKQAEATVKVVTEYVDRVKVVHQKGEEIIREVPVYIRPADYMLPLGFGVLHDAAATGVFPDASGDTDAATIDAAAALETVVGNYTTCTAIREQLISLQDWIRTQEAIAKE